MLDVNRIDLSELGELLDQREGGAGYFDPATGEVYRAIDGGVLDENGEPMDLDDVDWIELGGEGSREPYFDMETFAQAVADPVLSGRLHDALAGKGAFRRFRDIVHNTPQEIGRVWNRYRDARQEIRALEWLVDQGLVDEDAAAAARQPRIEAAEAALAEVSGAPGGRGVVVDLQEKLGRITEHWAPKLVARLNEYEVKLAKLEGEFVWHAHQDTDELFLVIDGTLAIQLRDGDVTLTPGQLYVVPRGVEHRPVADGEVAVMLVEPSGVVNTGDAGGALTAEYDDSLLD